MSVLLQSLSDYTNGGLLEAALSDLSAAVGGDAVFGLLVGGALILSFYLASSGGLATPAVLTTLIGGLMIPVLPAGYGRIAQVIMFLGLVAALAAGIDSWVDNSPAT